MKSYTRKLLNFWRSKILGEYFLDVFFQTKNKEFLFFQSYVFFRQL